jgi:hypothetical protein
LAISGRTVERHMVNILNKLGSTTRVQVATWVVTQGWPVPSRPPRDRRPSQGHA